MSTNSIPQKTAECLKVRVRTVEGPLTTLELLATDYHVVIGRNRNYLIGFGVAYAFSKEGMFILSGPVPAVLKEDRLPRTPPADS